MAGNQSSSKSIAFRCSTLHMLNMLASSLAPDDVGLGHCGVLGPCGRPLEMYSGKDIVGWDVKKFIKNVCLF